MQRMMWFDIQGGLPEKPVTNAGNAEGAVGPQANQPDTPTGDPKPTPRATKPEDGDNLKRTQNGGNPTGGDGAKVAEQLASAKSGLLSKLRTAQRLPEERKLPILEREFYNWLEFASGIPAEAFFPGKKGKDAFLADKFNSPKNHTEKLQAGLWLLGDDYGRHLGPFGQAGIDGKKGHFTKKAIAKFESDHAKEVDHAVQQLMAKPENKGKKAEALRQEAVEGLIIQKAEQKLQNQTAANAAPKKAAVELDEQEKGVLLGKAFEKWQDGDTTKTPKAEGDYCPKYIAALAALKESSMAYAVDPSTVNYSKWTQAINAYNALAKEMEVSPQVQSQTFEYFNNMKNTKPPVVTAAPPPPDPNAAKDPKQAT